MELYILRHGAAEEASESRQDKDRQLTAEGIEKTRASGRALSKLGIRFDLILTSPFTRTRQTAEIIGEESGATVRESDALSSGAGVTGIIKMLRGQAEPVLLLVGHEPEMSQLISFLISGSPLLPITMRKGSLCRLTCSRPEPARARLEWLVPPNVLCRVS